MAFFDTNSHFGTATATAGGAPKHAPSGHGRDDGGGLAAASAGLVPSKTSPLDIRFDKLQSAKRRIKRLRRSVWAAGHLHGLADHGHRPPVAWMVTLTYVGVDDWQADHISKASEQYRRHCARHRVPCGLTGWAAVNGLRGDTSIEDRARFDNYYIQNWSLWLDVKIIFRTVGAVITGAGG